MMTAAVAIFAGFAINIPPKDVVEMFEERLHPYPLTAQHDGHMLYSLFRPATIKPGKKYPLIVWLHGYGKEEFDEKNGQLMHVENILPSLEVAQKAQYFLLVPQCPRDQRGFYRSPPKSDQFGGDGASTPGDATVEIIKNLLNSEPIAEDRVSIVGISGGGIDAFKMTTRNPGIFAAISPLSAGGYNLRDLHKLTNVAVWAFNSSGERRSVNSIAQVIDHIKNLGGHAEATVINANIHGCWCSAFEDYDLLVWLLAQQRGSLLSPLPGRRPWQWHTWVVSIGVLLLTMEAVRREVLRQANCVGPTLSDIDIS